MTSRIPEPESPLEEEGIPDLSDALPGKAITGDAQEEDPVPRDFPVAVEDYGTTAAEQRAGEPLDLRVERELPDVTTAPTDDPYPDDSDRPIGRLVADREGGTNKEQDFEAHSVGSDGGGYAPEERAMHEEPPG
ncbi:MAG: DUF5709 domain-containing protein [Actinomycetes bacterium]